MAVVEAIWRSISKREVKAGEVDIES